MSIQAVSNSNALTALTIKIVISLREPISAMVAWRSKFLKLPFRLRNAAEILFVKVKIVLFKRYIVEVELGIRNPLLFL